MKLEIDIDQYVTEEDKRELAIEATKEAFANKLKSEEDMQRIISNNAFKFISTEVEKIIPNYTDVIIGKVVELINDKSFYSGHIFVSKDNYFNSDDSIAQQACNKAVNENIDSIKDNVVNAIKEFDYGDTVRDSIASTTDDLCSNIYTLSELLTKKN